MSKKVKLLSASIFDTGLRLVKREFQALHHAARPLQCLFRVSATENHEVVGVGDDASLPELSLPGYPPVLQEAIHVQVRKQGTDYPS